MSKIILLRGLAREVGHWGKFQAVLQETFPDYQVYPLEIPGAGTLREMVAPTRVEEYVTFLRRSFHKNSKNNSPALFLGLSFGAMIVSHWAAYYPEDISGVVLINSSSRPSPFYERITPQAIKTLLQTPFIQNTLKREKKIADLICNLADTENIAHQWSILAKKAPMKTTNIARQLMAAARFSAPARISAPTLLLNSTNDRMVSPRCSQRLAKLYRAELKVHPLAGHDLTTDDPVWVAERVRERFLA